MNEKLAISQMLNEAKVFAEIESVYAEPSLFGVTDGKLSELTSNTNLKHISQTIMKSLSAVRLRELICRN